MKITKSQLKQIIKEEIEKINEMLPLAIRMGQRRQRKSNIEMGERIPDEDLPDTLANDISDMYKEMNGIRPDPDKLAQMSLEELEALHDSISEDLRRHYDEEEHGLEEEKKTKVSKAGQKRVSRKIAHLIGDEGKSKEQAAAIAYSMEERGELK